MCYAKKGQYIESVKKCPNFIRTIGRHLDNLMKWLVRMGNTGVWGNDPEKKMRKKKVASGNLWQPVATCGNLW